MNPILYDATEREFLTNGKGILTDCVVHEVVEERNGSFELVIKYPTSGIHYEDIKKNCYIKTKVNQTGNLQLFRIYSISRPFNKIVEIRAEHISYWLNGIPVSPFSAENVAQAMQGFAQNSAMDCPFEFWTDKTTEANFSVDIPKSIRSSLGGTAGSILDVYGGEFEFDNFTVKLHNNRGLNRGVSIRYGKNLMDIVQEENCASVYTGLFPYWKDSDSGELIQLDEKIIYAEGQYDFQRIQTIDFSSEFETAPTQEQLRSRAQRYIEQNEIGVPSVSLSVSFAQLEQSEEYKGIALLERVYLCDYVNVEFPELMVSTTAKVTKVVYDGILDRIKSITLGSARANITETISAQQKEIEKIENPTFLQSAVSGATNWITNGKGVVVIKKNDAGQASEILVMDEPDIENAMQVWRWNNGGLGFSSNGYLGPYNTAITQDGKIVADFITTGILTANLIKAGILESLDGTFSINMENGNILIRDDEGNIILSFSKGYGLVLNGAIYSQEGEIGGFKIRGNTLEGSSLMIDPAGVIDLKDMKIRPQYDNIMPSISVYREDDPDGRVLPLLIEATGGVYIGGNNNSPLFVDNQNVEINSKIVSFGSAQCYGQWSPIPDERLNGQNSCVVASCSDKNGYIIKTRYQTDLGIWDWCIDGAASLSCKANWIAFC